MVPQDPGVGENALQETPQTQGEGRHASCEVRVPEATAARLLLQRWPDIEDEDAADSRDHTSHENGEVPMGPEAEPGAAEVADPNPAVDTEPLPLIPLLLLRI